MSVAEEILRTDRSRIEAMVAADEEALECFFTEDLTYTHTNGVLDTKAVLIDKIRTSAYDYAAIETADVRVKTIGEDAAVLSGEGVLSVRTSAGKTVDVPIRYTSVYVRDGLHWKMTAWQSTGAATAQTPN